MILGPALANIFVGFHDMGLLSSLNKPVIYFRYVNEIFCLFDNETEADFFLNSLDKIYPALNLH